MLPTIQNYLAATQSTLATVQNTLTSTWNPLGTVLSRLLTDYQLHDDKL